MKKKLIDVFIIVFVALSAGTSLADNQKPDLWKIEKDGKISYLFGSIHAGSQDMYPLSKTVMGAYDQTESLVVEVDVTAVDQAVMAQKFQQYGMNTSLPIEQRLSPATLEIYKQSCQAKTMPCEHFTAFKPWALSTVLLISKMQQLGYTPELGIDKHFLTLAHKADKNIISLETMESQLKWLSGFNQIQAERMLVESLQVNKKHIDDLFNAWKSGDDKFLLGYYTKGSEFPEIKKMYELLLDQRNFKMVSNISQLIASNKSLFVVVGAMHMVGKNGIVNLLKKEGFKVSQIQ